MNKLVLLALLATGTHIYSLRAETPTASEFTRLRQQQQKAVEAAMEPVNRRYQDLLQSLLRRATAAGDLDTALKVRAELQGLGATAPIPPPSSSLPSTSPATPPSAAPTTTDTATLEVRLIGTKWTFPMSSHPKDVQWITFKAKGALIAGWNPEANRTWKAISSDTVQVKPVGNQDSVYGIQFDPLLRSAKIVSGVDTGTQLERKK